MVMLSRCSSLGSWHQIPQKRKGAPIRGPFSPNAPPTAAGQDTRFGAVRGINWLPEDDAHRTPVIAIIDTFKIKVKRLWENHGKGKQVLAFA